jgi:hypothetical protein
MEPLLVVIKPRPGSRASVCSIHLFMCSTVEDVMIAVDIRGDLYLNHIRVFPSELLGALLIFSHGGMDSLVLNG